MPPVSLFSQNEREYHLSLKQALLQPTKPLTQQETLLFDHLLDEDYLRESDTSKDSVEQYQYSPLSTPNEEQISSGPSICFSPDESVFSAPTRRQSASASPGSAQLRQSNTAVASCQVDSLKNSSPCYPCTYKDCKSYFPTFRYLQRHLNRHRLPRHCLFPDCDTRLADQKEIDRHLARVHHHVAGESTSADNRCPATRCRRSFGVRRDALRRHVKGKRHVEMHGIFVI